MKKTKKMQVVFDKQFANNARLSRQDAKRRAVRAKRLLSMSCG